MSLYESGDCHERLDLMSTDTVSRRVKKLPGPENGDILNRRTHGSPLPFVCFHLQIPSTGICNSSYPRTKNTHLNAENVLSIHKVDPSNSYC